MGMKHLSRRMVELMGIFKGTLNECVMQVCSAILTLQKKFIKWSDEDERNMINAIIKRHVVLSIVLA